MTAIKDIRTGKWTFYGIGPKKRFVKTWGIPIAMTLSGCESTTQTAIRSNEVPAIAYVVAADKGQALPTAVIIREP